MSVGIPLEDRCLAREALGGDPLQRRGVREMQGGGWGSSSPAVRAPGTEGSGERPPQDQGGSQQGRRPRQGTDPEKQGRGPPWGRIWDKAPDLAQRAWSLPGDSRVSLRRRQVSQRETEEACPALPQCPAQAREWGGGGCPAGLLLPAAAHSPPEGAACSTPSLSSARPMGPPCGPRRGASVQGHRLLSFPSQLGNH